jgi:hypothetical protein
MSKNLPLTLPKMGGRFGSNADSVINSRRPIEQKPTMIGFGSVAEAEGQPIMVRLRHVKSIVTVKCGTNNPPITCVLRR